MLIFLLRMRASLALLIPRRCTNPMELPPSVTRPMDEKGVRRKVLGVAYTKSANPVKAAERPIAGPLRATTSSFG
jgi:hypothetical protein